MLLMENIFFTGHGQLLDQTLILKTSAIKPMSSSSLTLQRLTAGRDKTKDSISWLEWIGDLAIWSERKLLGWLIEKLVP